MLCLRKHTWKKEKKTPYRLFHHSEPKRHDNCLHFQPLLFAVYPPLAKYYAATVALICANARTLCTLNEQIPTTNTTFGHNLGGKLNKIK